MRNDEGYSLVSVMGSMVVGSLVIAMAAMFWINSGKGANRNADVSQQEAAALRVVNSIVGDVNNANNVVYASPKTLVTERQVKSSAGAVSTTRTRYTYEGTDIVQTRRTNAPSGAYDEATTFGDGQPGVTEKTVATRSAGEDMFDYFAMGGDPLPAGPLNGDDISKVKRVDISFKADAGKGYVELKTKAAVNKKRSSAEGDDIGLPGLICPAAPELINSAGSVKVRWNAVTDVQQYFVVRNGTKIGPIDDSFLSGGTYEWTDANPILGGVNTYSIEVRAGSEVRTDCNVSTISTPLPTPDASGVVDTNNNFDINWSAVNGATGGYRVYYREVNNSLYNEPKAWKSQDVTGTNLNLNEGGNAAREFYVIAMSGSIVSETSPRFVMLSAPTAPTLSARATTYNQNELSVLNPDNNLSMKATRQASGGPLAAKTASLPVESTTFVDGLDATFGQSSDFTAFKAGDDQKYLGYDYTYSAKTENKGPRSSAEWFSHDRDVWGVSFKGTPRESSESAAKTAKQFPSDPVTSATGSETNPVGTNKATWTAGRGATAYQVWRTFGNKFGDYEANDGDRFWETGTDRAFTDAGGAQRGTRHYYMAIASNETGMSPAREFGSDKRAAAFQLPGTPDVQYNFGKRPSLDTQIKPETSKPLGNFYQVDWALGNGEWQPDWPQQNQPAKYQFCDGTTSVCKYVTKVNGQTKKTSPHTDRVFEDTASGWGVKDDVTVEACNPGGCVTDSLDVKTYPGPFEQTDYDLKRQTMYVYQQGQAQQDDRKWRWGHSSTGNVGVNDSDYAGTKFSWSASEGAANYTALRGEWNGLWWAWDTNQKVSKTTLGTDFWTAQPSKVYRTSVYAESAFDSNLKRSVNGPQNQEYAGFDKGLNFSTLQTSPLPPSRLENKKMCYRTPSGTNKGKPDMNYYGSVDYYSDSTWNAALDGFQTYTPADSIGHYVTRGRVPATYMGTSWTSDGGPGSERNVPKILQHSAATLAAMEAGGPANSSSKKWVHQYQDTPYGPRSDGSKNAFGQYEEAMTATGMGMRNYIIHNFDTRLDTNSDAGNGKGPKFIDIDYQPNVWWVTSYDNDCGFGYGWVDVAKGDSIQRRGTPEAMVPNTVIPQAVIPKSLFWYYTGQGGNVVSYTANEQPAKTGSQP